LDAQPLEQSKKTFVGFGMKDRVVVVTGGSRGLGRAMVDGFADAGADVAIASRKIEACRAAAAEITKRTGRRAKGYACHVGHWSELDQLVADIYADFGRIDVLVNNAGMQPHYPSPIEITEELWDKVFGVNVKGPFRLAALVGTQMVKDGGGSIINISSTGSIRPRANVIPYAAAKAGLNAMTEALAHAFGPTVRVNTIMPGPFLTDVSATWDADPVAGRAGGTLALGRAGQPEEIIGAALYLASDAGSFTTGSIIRVDGGIP
jgi:NAD(P)-dependent dehydrogenase (short-subunit alcohol dehydrogenase family)